MKNSLLCNTAFIKISNFYHRCFKMTRHKILKTDFSVVASDQTRVAGHNVWLHQDPAGFMWTPWQNVLLHFLKYSFTFPTPSSPSPSLSTVYLAVISENTAVLTESLETSLPNAHSMYFLFFSSYHFSDAHIQYMCTVTELPEKIPHIQLGLEIEIL